MADHLFAALDREWNRIARSPAATRRLRQWATAEVALAGFTNVGEVIERCQRRDDPQCSDTILAALARLAPTDTDAARVVLQAVIPALTNIARAYRWLGPDEADAAVIVAAWERIRTYPTSRPQRIAANITFDVRKQLARSARRHANELAAIEHLPLSSPEPSPEDDALRQLNRAVQLGRLTPADASLIASTRIAGHPLGHTPIGARQRRTRDRAEDRLEGRR